MTSILRRVPALSMAALAASLTASAADLASPVHSGTPGAGAAAPAIAGQETLALDRAALEALRAESTEARIASFPLGPGLVGAVTLRRFEVLAPGARITIGGKDGET